MRKYDEWTRVFRTSNLQVDVVRWGVAFYVLAPVWFASIFPWFQEWIAFGYADEASRIRVMTKEEEQRRLRMQGSVT